MSYRVLPLVLAALALAVFVAAPALAEKAAKGNTHEGTVVQAGDGKLTMMGKDKKEHSHEVADNAVITCEGKKCKLEDLKKGFMVKVTVAKVGDKTEVTKIEAKKPKASD